MTVTRLDMSMNGVSTGGDLFFLWMTDSRSNVRHFVSTKGVDTDGGAAGNKDAGEREEEKADHRKRARPQGRRNTKPSRPKRSRSLNDDSDEPSDSDTENDNSLPRRSPVSASAVTGDGESSSSERASDTRTPEEKLDAAVDAVLSGRSKLIEQRDVVKLLDFRDILYQCTRMPKWRSWADAIDVEIPKKGWGASAIKTEFEQEWDKLLHLKDGVHVWAQTLRDIAAHANRIDFMRDTDNVALLQSHLHTNRDKEDALVDELFGTSSGSGAAVGKPSSGNNPWLVDGFFNIKTALADIEAYFKRNDGPGLGEWTLEATDENGSRYALSLNDAISVGQYTHDTPLRDGVVGVIGPPRWARTWRITDEIASPARLRLIPNYREVPTIDIWSADAECVIQAAARRGLKATTLAERQALVFDHLGATSSLTSDPITINEASQQYCANAVRLASREPGHSLADARMRAMRNAKTVVAFNVWSSMNRPLLWGQTVSTVVASLQQELYQSSVCHMTTDLALCAGEGDLAVVAFDYLQSIRMSIHHCNVFWMWILSISSGRIAYGIQPYGVTIVISGVPESGKSTIMTYVLRLLVDGTVQMLTRTTTMAPYSKQNEVGMVRIQQEMPAKYLGLDRQRLGRAAVEQQLNPQAASSAPDAELVKDELTSNIIRTQSMYVQDGNRIQTMTAAMVFGLRVFGSNVPASVGDGAMVSRLPDVFAEVTPPEGPLSAISLATDLRKRQPPRSVDLFHFIHRRMVVAAAMMNARAIEPPTVDIAVALLKLGIMRFGALHFNVTQPTRHVLTMCDNLHAVALCRALRLACITGVGGPPPGVAFDPIHMRCVEPLAYCHPHDAACVTMLPDTLGVQNAVMVAETLRCAMFGITWERANDKAREVCPVVGRLYNPELPMQDIDHAFMCATDPMHGIVPTPPFPGPIVQQLASVIAQTNNGSMSATVSDDARARVDLPTATHPYWVVKGIFTGHDRPHGGMNYSKDVIRLDMLGGMLIKHNNRYTKEQFTGVIARLMRPVVRCDDAQTSRDVNAAYKRTGDFCEGIYFSGDDIHIHVRILALHKLSLVRAVLNCTPADICGSTNAGDTTSHTWSAHKLVLSTPTCIWRKADAADPPSMRSDGLVFSRAYDQPLEVPVATRLAREIDEKVCGDASSMYKGYADEFKRHIGAYRCLLIPTSKPSVDIAVSTACDAAQKIVARCRDNRALMSLPDAWFDSADVIHRLCEQTTSVMGFSIDRFRVFIRVVTAFNRLMVAAPSLAEPHAADIEHHSRNEHVALGTVILVGEFLKKTRADRVVPFYEHEVEALKAVDAYVYEHITSTSWAIEYGSSACGIAKVFANASPTVALAEPPSTQYASYRPGAGRASSSASSSSSSSSAPIVPMQPAGQRANVGPTPFGLIDESTPITINGVQRTSVKLVPITHTRWVDSIADRLVFSGVVGNTQDARAHYAYPPNLARIVRSCQETARCARRLSALIVTDDDIMPYATSFVRALVAETHTKQAFDGVFGPLALSSASSSSSSSAAPSRSPTSFCMSRGHVLAYLAGIHPSLPLGVPDAVSLFVSAYRASSTVDMTTCLCRMILHARQILQVPRT
jgi:hypothetical protein